MALALNPHHGAGPKPPPWRCVCPAGSGLHLGDHFSSSAAAAAKHSAGTAAGLGAGQGGGGVGSCAGPTQLYTYSGSSTVLPAGSSHDWHSSVRDSQQQQQQQQHAGSSSLFLMTGGGGGGAGGHKQQLHSSGGAVKVPLSLSSGSSGFLGPGSPRVHTPNGSGLAQAHRQQPGGGSPPSHAGAGTLLTPRGGQAQVEHGVGTLLTPRGQAQAEHGGGALLLRSADSFATASYRPGVAGGGAAVEGGGWGRGEPGEGQQALKGGGGGGGSGNGRGLDAFVSKLSPLPQSPRLGHTGLAGAGANRMAGFERFLPLLSRKPQNIA